MIKDLKNKPPNFSGIENHLLDGVENKKLEILRARLQEGITQIENGEGVDGETFMAELMKSPPQD